MVQSKGWQWELLKEDEKEQWRNPAWESYYLVNRWKGQGKRVFLDLGCGLGRHSILFGKNGFQVNCFDISELAVNATREWAGTEGLSFRYAVGDMLALPYADDSIDCIMCRNVISHTDTEGVRKTIAEIRRVLRLEGECFLTIPSKETWGFKQEDRPALDENTRICTEPGTEYGVQHFYADYEQLADFFSGFSMESVSHVQTFNEYAGKPGSSWHYHILIRK